MIMSEGTRGKRYGLFCLAIILLLSGAAAFLLRPQNLTISSLGIIAVLASVYFVRVSRIHVRKTHRENVEGADLASANRPSRLMWILGVGLLMLVGVAYWLMYLDALHGGHARWPADMFFGVGIACAGVWGYLISKSLRQGG